MDMLGRIGGEEFLLFMPNCSLATAKLRLAALQEVTGRTALEGGDHQSLSFTFSAGVVALRPGEDIHDEIRRADRLLYRAKSDGRACVRG
ncbi:hypothetical protein C5F48_14335 [Cereibacter changlensis JA139]|uniref:diguanylate cyclase n=1 Tax=Cereibacter changlensis JA139 TaxID=1188249 RepID=A0A2T4JT17_9RHOB|nr:hypothetical protein C5F48_14335 [Cereibacter changlensis JA139]